MNSLHYYVPENPAVSFHQIGLKYASCLAKLGWDVQTKYMGQGEQAESGELAVLHPLLYLTQKYKDRFSAFLQDLGKKYQFVFGLEVADSTRISDRFVAWANLDLIKGLMLPSAYSLRAFQESGVKTPMAIVPHGFEAASPSDRFDFLKEIKTPKSLSFVINESHRKGWDMVLKGIVAHPDCLFIVKGPLMKDRPFYEKKENILVINHWLDPSDLASLYANVDFLFAPHRGGAFELNCLEASCYGLPVLASDYGPVLEYLDPKANLFIPVRNEKILWAERKDHCGLGADLDAADVLKCLGDMLVRFEDLKKQSLAQSVNLREQFNWAVVTEKMDTFIRGRL
ncbi:MAG: hypothetical protein ACD_73C00790G0001 [uncultured bacterium]|nr:MAG: hypothetical protein ACD_73C00790G0001 [uncultured bacterium]